MKTTKLINGKTFDEVFAERGKETSVENMQKGEIYLLGKTYEDDWDVLHKHDRTSDSKLFGSKQLFDNISMHSGGFIYCDEVCGIYHATPNQIELLNMYINHEN